jgi:hypothetical protein
MKKLLSIVALLLVVLIMALTKPSKEAHRAAMMDAVQEYVADEASGHVALNLLASIGGKALVKAVDLALSTQLKERDYLVLNTTYIEIGDQEKLLSVGLLSYVFTFDKERLRSELATAFQGK